MIVHTDQAGNKHGDKKNTDNPLNNRKRLGMCACRSDITITSGVSVVKL